MKKRAPLPVGASPRYPLLIFRKVAMLFDLLIRVAAFLFTVGILVVAHELGHYVVARICKVKVLRFSFGFGKVLYSKRLGRDQTEWAISAIPLGGYVKMLDERESEAAIAESDLPRAFNRQPVGNRFAIVAAGPLTNLLLAVLLLTLTYIVGVADYQSVLRTPRPDTPAAQLHLQSLDRIVAVNGTAVEAWSDLRWHILKNLGNEVTLTIHRDQRVFDMPISLIGYTADEEAEGKVFERFGLYPYYGAPLITAVRPDMPAAAAGIRVGDIVTAIDGVTLESPGDFVRAIHGNEGQPLVFTIRRDHSLLEVTVVPVMASLPDAKKPSAPQVGVGLSYDDNITRLYATTIRYNPIDALSKGAVRTGELAWMSIKMFGRIIVGSASLKNLSGPITIADYAGQSILAGFERFVTFLALVSIALAVINLLPIPLLDGGHLLYYSAEIVRRRPVSEKTMEIGAKIGIAFIVFLVFLTLTNDFARLF
jgi:regulator of sigma E protease